MTNYIAASVLLFTVAGVTACGDSRTENKVDTQTETEVKTASREIAIRVRGMT